MTFSLWLSSNDTIFHTPQPFTAVVPLHPRLYHLFIILISCIPLQLPYHCCQSCRSEVNSAKNLVWISRLKIPHIYPESMKRFITHIMKLFRKNRAGSMLIWIWLEGAEKGDCLRFLWWLRVGVEPGRIFLHMGWVLHYLNFPLVLKEWAPRLSYQFFQVWGTGKEEWWGLKVVSKY